MTRDFDLNLLRVLLALDRSRHVTQAAESLGMSQSGFSTALARLRRHSGDALFVRLGGRMAPTPRAERMVATAQAVLAQVEDGILGTPEFRPMDSRTEFHLAMADVAEVVILPRLLRHLQRVAPQATVRSANHDSEALRSGLAEGRIDLALGFFPDLAGSSFVSQRFYTHTFAAMARRGHPLSQQALAGQPLSNADYLAVGHAAVSSPARSTGLLEGFLERRGLQRQVVLHTPHHLALPGILEQTDLLATLPLAAGARLAQLGALQLLRLPFEPPSFPVQQHWHRRVQHDARHRWLREQVASLFSEASDDWRQIEAALYGPDYRQRQSRRTAR